VDNLNTTAGIVAIAAGAVAIVAVGWSVGLTVAMRRLRAAQRAVLGDSSRDLVTHAAHLQSSFETLAQYVEDFGARLDRRMNRAEVRLDGAVAHRALVRYDAYGEMSGRQSTSIALLDATSSGVVLSSIHHRDTARLYAKQIRRGQPEIELSPEESEAVRLALAGATAPSEGGEPGDGVTGGGPAGAPGGAAGGDTPS
jgi:Protein of unknown function (DUF4446)